MSSQQYIKIIGNSCTPVADSCQCMAKPIQYCKAKKSKNKNKKKRMPNKMNSSIGYFYFMKLILYDQYHL